jgi:hypothetical protein
MPVWNTVKQVPCFCETCRHSTDFRQNPPHGLFSGFKNGFTTSQAIAYTFSSPREYEPPVLSRVGFFTTCVFGWGAGGKGTPEISVSSRGKQFHSIGLQAEKRAHRATQKISKPLLD